MLHKNILRTSFLGAAFIAMSSIGDAEPVIDVYVSTGDNHFLGSSLPIDSPASIEATFDLFKNVNHARRIYWRGLEEACWISTMHVRSENPRYHSLWEWMRWLYANVKPDGLAVKAAHARGMEIWGMGSLWDWGSLADTPTFGDYPFPFESKLKLEHPEWAPVDKHGARRQGGPIELAYPEARKALVDLTVKETLDAGYDGIMFLTYVENFSLRFQDEFGYSDPIVKNFKAQYGINIRTEPFRRGASREDWLRLRGGYITAFLRELKAELDKHRIKLGIVVNSNDPRQAQSWNVPDLIVTAGSHQMDVDTWVREGLVDELLIYGNNSPQSQYKALDDLLFLARGTKTSVSVLTSGPFRDGWKPYQAKGVPTVLAISDDSQHLERGFVSEQAAQGLKSEDVYRRMRVLQQCIAGSLALDEDAIIERASSTNLIERRLALQALGKLKSANIKPLFSGLNDPENGVRCVAALAMATRRDPAACQALLQAAEQHGNHMLRECVIIALRRLAPLPTVELTEAALHSKSDNVREVAMRTLMVHATADLLPVFREGLKDAARFPRFAAAESLGSIAKSDEAIDLLIATLNDKDSAVANRAAVSLGKLAALKRPETASLRPKVLAALIAAFKKHGDANRDDAEWGWRPIGNAVLDFGDEGTVALRQIRDQRDDMRLAELAWRVVDLPQQKSVFSAVSAEQNEEAMKRRPGGAGTPPELHVNPTAGNDANDGRAKPVKTIARAIAVAKPGDTVHLAPGRYRESAVFINKLGEPGRPITFDGRGAILDGAEPLNVADWRMTAPGLYRNDHLLTMNPAILVRWFFIFDGRMNHMGRTSKGPSAPLKKPEELAPGEWTYIPAALITREKTKDGKPWDSAHVAGAFFIKIDPAKTLADYRIEAPLRSSGVQFGGRCEHIVVRNVTATHVHNDGFNIHGDQRDLAFDNIASVECGDDGFSAHEAAECRIDGFVSIGNSTGLCDTGTSQTHYKNVFIRDCLGFDLYFIGLAHSMENAVIESSAARAFLLDGSQLKAGAICNLALKNVLIRRVGGGPRELRIGSGGRLRAERCTFLDLNVTMTPGAAIEIQKCILGGGEAKPDVLLYANTIWRGDENVYDVKSLRVGTTSFAQKAFAEFQRLTASESKSRWETTTIAPAGVGVDESLLKKLRRP